MKYTLAIIALTLTLATPVVAQTTTKSASTPTPTTTSKLDDLKDRLATKVAQLRQLTKRAIAGSVKATSVSTFTVETKTSDIKIELTDDIAVVQFLKGKRTELKTENIEQGDEVVVFGDYDSGLELLKAKVVFIQGALPTRVAGTVTKTDAKAFTITIETNKDETYTIDFERTTITNKWNAGIETSTKIGFSTIAAGDTIHVLGTPVSGKTNQISATRILHLGNLTGSTPTPTPEAEEEITPKATPTKPAAKPTATPTP